MEKKLSRAKADQVRPWGGVRRNFYNGASKMERNEMKLYALGHTTIGLLVAIQAAPGQTAVELYEGTKELFINDNVNPGQVLTSLKRVRERGLVTVKGKGIANAPHRYYLTEKGEDAANIVLNQYTHRTMAMTAMKASKGVAQHPENVIPLKVKQRSG